MFAIFQIGGRQYKASPGATILTESLDGKLGDILTFQKVLLFMDENDIKIGTPFVSNVEVQTKVLEQGKADKVITVKMIPKKRHTRFRGHRQLFTKLEIVHIGPTGSKPKPVIEKETEKPKPALKKQRAGASKTVKATPTETEVS